MLVRVVDITAPSRELLDAAQRWLPGSGADHNLDGCVCCVCEDGEEFTPTEGVLHVLVPSCGLAVGDTVDVSGAEPLGLVLPDIDSPPEDVPQQLAVALRLERSDQLWIAAAHDAAEPGPTEDELFAVDDPRGTSAVIDATGASLAGAMAISGDAGGRLWFIGAEGNVAAWGASPAHARRPFIGWLGRPEVMKVSRFLRRSTRVTGNIEDTHLMLRDQHGETLRCKLADGRQAPTPLPNDYFVNHAQGTVDGLGVDRDGGFGADALRAITDCRPEEVTLAVLADGSLRIGDDGPAGNVVSGPGFTTLEGRRDVPIRLPYVVALKLHAAARTGRVELLVDAARGHLFQADHGVTVQWVR